MTENKEKNQERQQKNCPICGSAESKFLFKNWDWGHGYPGKYPLWSCRDCRHIWVAAEFTPEMLTDMYTNYYPRRNFDLDQWKPFPETSGFFAWLDGDNASCHRHVLPNVRILDIGCGYCEALGYHKARGCEVYGCEADDNTQRIAEKNGFSVHNGLFDTAEYEENLFDYVTMHHVIEHLVDPYQTLRRVHKVLKPGGKLIFSTPYPFCIERYLFGRYWVGWHTPFHLNIFTKKSVQILLEQTGFHFEKSQSCTPSCALLNNWAVLFVHGKEGQPCRFRTVSSAQVESLGTEAERLWYVRFYRFLEKLRLFSWASRFSDALGIGQHCLYFAAKQ